MAGKWSKNCDFITFQLQPLKKTGNRAVLSGFCGEISYFILFYMIRVDIAILGGL